MPCAIGSRPASASSARRDSTSSTLNGFAASARSTAPARAGSRSRSHDLVQARGPGTLEVHGSLQRLGVADDRLAVDAGKAPDRADDADGEPLAGELERQQPARVRRSRESRA